MALLRLTHSIIVVKRCRNELEGMGVVDETLVVSLNKNAPGGDLGDGSQYASESFEDRSGEGVHVHSSWTWVSRSWKTGVFLDTQALLRIFKSNGVNIVQQDVDNIQWRKAIRECRWELREALSLLCQQPFTLKTDCVAIGVNVVKHLVIRCVLKKKPKNRFICHDRTHSRITSLRLAVSLILVESHSKQQ